MADCPEGGDRCLACFALRLNETGRRAAENGFELIDEDGRCYCSDCGRWEE